MNSHPIAGAAIYSGHSESPTQASRLMVFAAPIFFLIAALCASVGAHSGTDSMAHAVGQGATVLHVPV